MSPRAMQMRAKLLAATAAETMILRARQLVTDAMNNLHAVQAEGTGCADHALMPLIRAARDATHPCGPRNGRGGGTRADSSEANTDTYKIV